MVVFEYLKNIWEVDNPLTLHTNAGKSKTNKRGELGGTTFWLDETVIANVISLRTPERKFKVTYDSMKDRGAFLCETPEGTVRFERCPTTGFPYVDLKRYGKMTATMLVQTMRKNFEGYTREEVERAILARKMQARAGHPSETAVRYVTIQFVPKRKAGELVNTMKMVVGLYWRAGIICQTASMDGEFEKKKQKLINIIEVNITARNEHVPKIERKIWHIKERVRSTKADLPYEVIPNIMIKRMVLNAGLF
eukprot:CCRYP_002163-RA/>CCRYP_002163-RA protein AED:0.35 eAED:0.35 QI:0/0/0/1/0/0/2/0/250